MKVTKILYLAVVSAGLFLSSCSMNKEANNTSYLQSGKLLAAQQLTIQSNQSQPMVAIDACSNEKIIQNDIPIAPENLSFVKVPVTQKHSRSFVANDFIKKAGKTLAQTITLPKALGTINRLTQKPTSVASKKGNPFAGMNYLVMWIVCLIASILLYAIGALLGPIGIIFDILGLIAGIFFVVFLILWILQLAKG